MSLLSPELAGRFFTTRATWETWSQSASLAKIKHKDTHVAPGAEVKDSGWLTLEGYGDCWGPPTKPRLNNGEAISINKSGCPKEGQWESGTQMPTIVHSSGDMKSAAISSRPVTHFII